jgi:adenosylhomocysteinase
LSTLTEDLDEIGRRSFEWARAHMPVFTLAERHLQSKLDQKRDLFRGLRLAACLHVSKETAVLISSLRSLGIEIDLVAANPLSSQDEIVNYLKSTGVNVVARRDETVKEYEKNIVYAANSEPDLIVDDGSELHVAYAETNSNSCIGGTDETTSGTLRLKALDIAGKLRYPSIPVNEAKTKHIFDNKFGTGQSAVDGLIRSTGLLLAGKIVVVAGYGWVGKGVADCARGLGSKVIVSEIDAVKALEANLDGFQVMPMKTAAKVGNLFLTCTGQIGVLTSKHFKLMKDGAILGNVGHFDKEIDVEMLYRSGKKVEQVRRNITQIEIGKEPKRIYLLCQGRVINLVAAEGHPPEIMQLSFANQLLSIYYLLRHRKELGRRKSKLIPFPEEIDNLVANLALKGFGLKIDRLNERQKRYSGSFIRNSS